MSASTQLLVDAAPMGTSGGDLESGTAGFGSSSAPRQGSAAGVSGRMETGGSNNTETSSIFKQSSHPTVLFFHLLFRTAALLIYLFGWIFTSSFIFTFVIIVLLLAFDFWTVKNVTGRLLVGLRWWNEIKEDGTEVWIFESKQDRDQNPVDSRIFWGSLYATPAIWVLFGLGALFKLSFSWLLCVFVALVLNLANVIGYTRCEKDARAKLTNYIANQSGVQSFFGNMISNRIGSFFGGSSSNPPSS